MAIRVMAAVWDNYPGGGTELLALLALADWSDDEGRCWPSIASIGKKTRLSRSQAQRVVHRLIEAGYVTVTGNETGGAPGSTRQYRINFNKLLTGSVDATPTGSTHATGSMDAAEGSHLATETGSTHATQTVSEPPVHVNAREQARISPSSSKTKRPETTLAMFLESCKANSEKTILDDDPIFEYAEKVGINHEMLSVAWKEFKAAFLPTSKRQKDWRAHFRNAIRRNWYKLWFLKDGADATWTTAGEQARRAAA